MKQGKAMSIWAHSNETSLIQFAESDDEEEELEDTWGGGGLAKSIQASPSSVDCELQLTPFLHV